MRYTPLTMKAFLLQRQCFLPACVGSVLLACSPLAAQAVGTIAGRITDPVGSPIPGARLEVTSPDTGVARSTTTNADGLYRIPSLSPGQYEVEASAPGFQAVRSGRLRLNLEETLRVDLVLPVAGVAETLTVTAQVPVTETSHVTLGQVIDERAVLELPLNGRNFAQLGTLMPGVVAPPESLGGARGDATPGGFGGTTTGFSVNGQRNQSNNFLLDGATNNDTFNSGFVLRPPPDAIQEFRILTHNYSAEYGRNSGSVVNVVTRSGTNRWHGSAWEFNRDDALEARNFFARERPTLRQNQFGGAAGGPVARNRWFLFGYYEGYRNTQGVTASHRVLTAAEREGDFSALAGSLRDPSTGLPFPGNRIPEDRLDPLALRLLDEYVPLPNSPGNRYTRSPEVADRRHQFGIRLDGQINPGGTLFVRYLFSDGSLRNPLGGSDFSPAGQNSESRLQDLMLSHTQLFGPSLIHVGRVSFNRIFARPQTTSGIAAADLGFETPNTQPSAVGLPYVSLSGYFSLGDGQQIFSRRVNHGLQVSDDFSYLHGRHFLRFGLNLLRETVRVAFLNRPNGDHTFDGTYTRNAAADFLLGLSRRYRQGGGDPVKDGTGWLVGLYLQDDIDLAPTLTLNLGLRYELPVPFQEVADRVNGWLPGVRSTVFPEAPAGLVYPGDPGIGRGIIRTDRNNLAPRLGLAWSPSPSRRTVLRAGWGVFYDSIPQQGDLFQNILAPPFNPLTQIDFPSNLSTPRLADPFLDGRGLQLTGFPLPVTFIGWGLDEPFRSAWSQHYHLSVQQEIPGGRGVVEAAWVGSRGYNYPGFLERNPGVYQPGQTTRGPRLYPEFGLIRPTYSRFRSWYDALQLSWRRSSAEGSAWWLSYTWGHSLDHVSGLNLGEPPRPQDGVSLEDIKGNSQFDVRHRLVLSLTRPLPAIADGPSAVRALLSGWRISSILQLQGGFPFTAVEPQDIALRYQQNRPDQVCDPNQDAPHTPQQWFRTACFQRKSLPEDAGEFGTAGRNTIRGPGLFLVDLGLLRQVKVSEGVQMELRFEAFNLFNRANFSQLVTNVAAQDFGAVTSARDARVVQIGIKALF
jgi:hypothetical protein